MSITENSLYSGLNMGGCSLMGEDIAPTLVSRYETQTGNTQDKLNVVTYRKTAHPMNAEQGQGFTETDVNDTLNVYDNSESRTPTLVLENHPADSRVNVCEDGVFQTLSSRMGTGGGNVPMVEENAVVRRLTPKECERLQGYPDGWTDIGEWIDSKGKKHKDADSPRYKALGNSIALPFWQWMAERIVKQLKADGTEHPTMASLFDGIGGFPLVFQRCGCKPVWASEIEEFPIAVTKVRFPEEENEHNSNTEEVRTEGRERLHEGERGTNEETL